MNTNKEVIYTMIGGILIKDVPDDAVKVKILSNGFIYFINKSGGELLGYCIEPKISIDSDKFSFVVFDIPPRAPKLKLVSNELTVVQSKGGMIENGKTYIVGEQGLPAEAVQFYGRANRAPNDAPERFTNIYKRAHSSSSSIISFCENVMAGKYMTIEELKCDFSKVDFGFTELKAIIESYPFLNSVSPDSSNVERSINIDSNNKTEKSSCGKSGTCKNIMQGFAQVVENFMNVYNEEHRKDDYPALGRDLLNRCILRNGKFISGDIIYLNDGDYGIVDSVLKDGYELLMNSSDKYHCVSGDGRGVTVFGSLELNHGLSVDWNKTLSKFYEDTLK